MEEADKDWTTIRIGEWVNVSSSAAAAAAAAVVVLFTDHVTWHICRQLNGLQPLIQGRILFQQINSIYC